MAGAAPAGGLPHRPLICIRHQVARSEMIGCRGHHSPHLRLGISAEFGRVHLYIRAYSHPGRRMSPLSPDGCEPRREPRGLAAPNKRRATQASRHLGRGPLGKAPGFARCGVIPRGCATSTSCSECLAPHQIRHLRHCRPQCEQALVQYCTHSAPTDNVSCRKASTPTP